MEEPIALSTINDQGIGGSSPPYVRRIKRQGSMRRSSSPVPSISLSTSYTANTALRESHSTTSTPTKIINATPLSNNTHAHSSPASAVSAPQSASSSCDTSCAMRGAIVLAHFCELHGPSVVMCTVQTVPSRYRADSQHWHRHTHNSSSPSSPAPNMATSLYNPPHGTYAHHVQHSITPTRDSGQNSPAFYERMPGLSEASTPDTLTPKSPRGLPTSLRLDPSSPFAATPNDSPSNSSEQGSDTRRSTSAASSQSTTAGCTACNILPPDSGFLSHDENGTGASTFYITTRYPSSLYSRIRTACVRSLSCEFHPGREGAFLFGDADNGFTLAYVFKLADIQARGGYRWYGLLFFHHHIHVVQHWYYVTHKFHRLISELQKRAGNQFEKEHQQSLTTTNSTTSTDNRFASGPGALRRRPVRSVTALRSLQKLLNLDNLSKILHQRFTATLAGCARRTWLFRKPLMPSLMLTLPSKLFAAKIRSYGSHSYSEDDQDDNKFLLSGKGQTSESDDFNDHIPSSSGSSSREPTTLDDMQDGSEINKGDGATDKKEGKSGSESALRTGEEDLEAFSGHKQVLHALGVEPIMRILDHLVCGNQVIVRGSSKRLVASLLHLLADFLPAGCVQMLQYEERYVDSYQCNMLGLSSRAKLPDYLDPANYALIDIAGGVYGQPEAWTFYQYTCTASPCPSPLTIIYMNILRLHLHPAVLSRLISNKRDEWLGKARTFYAMRRMLVQEADARMQRLLQVLGLTSEDLLAIRFFATAVVSEMRPLLSKLPPPAFPPLPPSPMRSPAPSPARSLSASPAPSATPSPSHSRTPSRSMQRNSSPHHVLPA